MPRLGVPVRTAPTPPAVKLAAPRRTHRLVHRLEIGIRGAVRNHLPKIRRQIQARAQKIEVFLADREDGGCREIMALEGGAPLVQ